LDVECVVAVDGHDWIRVGGRLGPGTKLEIVRELLKSLETKDPKPARYINSTKYIQHNLGVGDGPEAVARHHQGKYHADFCRRGLRGGAV
jgi:hypothetical protein